MKRVKTTIICLLAVLIANSAVAAVRYVPDDYPNIQAAVSACSNGDTVVVEPGIYTGSSNRDINFNGKAITVRSIDPADPNIVNSTVIDCNGQGRGFVFQMGENADSTVSGLTITNGSMFLGGAVYCLSNSSPSIINCVITGNSSVFGGAIACANSNTRPRISNCKIIANSALFGGGGIYCNGASPEIRSCVITGNSSLYGGAIYSHKAGNPVITNCTISGNNASISAGGIYCSESSNLTISNIILWGNIAPNASEVMVGNSGTGTSIQISYCDIQGPDENVVHEPGCTVNWGLGNIDVDPLFVDAVGGDYHLLEESPCIDAGDPDFVAVPGETDIDGEPRISGAEIDLGADELVLAIPAEVKITPKTLNPESKGWITCIISLPDNYDIGEVDTDSITLNGVRRAKCKTNEKKQTLLVKFDRSKIFD
ncbi:MAG: choice-of-anchor Q domain-containing protein, partial [Planctomycetota bacterium]